MHLTLDTSKGSYHLDIFTLGMRLINTGTLRLETFWDERHLPPYAILSHRWMDLEVQYPDMVALGSNSIEVLNAEHETDDDEARSWKKICQTCKLASRHGLEFAWIDTCCIEKSSSSELSEAINSMFRWYENAAICYVYMFDVDDLCASRCNDSPPDGLLQSFQQSEWFDRGWTLQELVAPSRIQFYSSTWNLLGGWGQYYHCTWDLPGRWDFSYTSTVEECSILDQTTLVDLVVARSGIDVEVLSGMKPLSRVGIATKMSWASKRKTTRIEDEAYCLLGMFDVNMPMLYGEGHKAFLRLQEEIIRHSNDQTVFAWNGSQGQMFAPSPASFINSGSIVPFHEPDAASTYQLTKQGLRVEALIVYWKRRTWGSRTVVEEDDGILAVQDVESHITGSAYQGEDSAAGSIRSRQPSSPKLGRAGPDVKISVGIDAALDVLEAPCVFMTLDCFHIDRPAFFPALKLKVVSWDDRSFALDGHKILYLPYTDTKFVWLECLAEHTVTAPSNLSMSRLTPSLQSFIARRRVFPLMRNKQTINIQHEPEHTGVKLRYLPICILKTADTVEYTADKCWPKGSWDLKNPMTLFPLVGKASSVQQFILRFVGPDGNGFYMLLGVSEGELRRVYMVPYYRGTSSDEVLRFLESDGAGWGKYDQPTRHKLILTSYTTTRLTIEENVPVHRSRYGIMLVVGAEETSRWQIARSARTLVLMVLCVVLLALSRILCA